MVALMFLAAFLVSAAPRPASAEDAPLPANASLPNWPKPTAPELAPGSPALHSQDLEVIHSRGAFGGFIVRVAGQPVAAARAGQ